MMIMHDDVHTNVALTTGILSSNESSSNEFVLVVMWRHPEKEERQSYAEYMNLIVNGRSNVKGSYSKTKSYACGFRVAPSPEVKSNT
jgi:hypothetical protein